MPRSALRDPVSGAQESITQGPFAEMTSPVPHNLGCFPTFLMKPNLTFSRRCSVLLYGPHGPILRPGVGCLPYNLHGKFQASGLKDAAVYRELVRSDSLLNYAHIFFTQVCQHRRRQFFSQHQPRQTGDEGDDEHSESLGFSLSLSKQPDAEIRRQA